MLDNDREDSADAAKVDDDLPPLGDPASASKADLRKAIQDSVQNPIYDVVVHICCRAFWHNCSSGRWALQRNCLGSRWSLQHVANKSTLSVDRKTTD